MKWKSIAAIAAVIMGTAGLSGCGAQSGGDEVEVLTGIAADTAQYAALESAVDAFEAENQGTKIRLVPRSGSFEEDIKVRLAARNTPDIINTHGWSRDRYSAFLRPLSDQPWAGELSPALKPAMVNDQGEFFALPIDVAISGIVYSTAALEKAGIDPQAIKTWGDFEAAATAVKAAGITPIAVSGKDNWTAGNLSDWAAPGYYAEADLTKLKDGAFDAGRYASMLTRLAEWRAKGFYNPDYSSATASDVTRLIATGEAAFSFQGNAVAPSAIAMNPQIKLGYIPVPSEVGAPYLIGGESVALGMAKGGPHEAEALSFLKFLAKPDVLGPLAESIGNAPGLTGAKPALGIMQHSYDTWVTAAEVPVVPFFDRVYLPSGMWAPMVSASDAMITGQSSPADAAAQMKTSFNSLFKQD